MIALPLPKHYHLLPSPSPRARFLSPPSPPQSTVATQRALYGALSSRRSVDVVAGFPRVVASNYTS